jgi:hypothetical protein
MMEAELYRLKGELMLKKNDSNSAELRAVLSARSAQTER